ncbi:hypothetical protein OFC57_39420, partial [Escherichia coli]|nr:hypothetical protein [Escherichia coli]
DFHANVNHNKTTSTFKQLRQIRQPSQQKYTQTSSKLTLYNTHFIYITFFKYKKAGLRRRIIMYLKLIQTKHIGHGIKARRL